MKQLGPGYPADQQQNQEQDPDLLGRNPSDLGGRWHNLTDFTFGKDFLYNGPDSQLE